MYLTKTIGRWQLELHQRAIYLTRQPKADPKCAYCLGHGGHGWVTEFDNVDWEDCTCVEQIRTWRLPLWPRSNRAYRTEPF